MSLITPMQMFLSRSEVRKIENVKRFFMNKISFITLAVASLLFSSAAGVSNPSGDQTSSSRSSSTNPSQDRVGTQSVTTPTDSTSQRRMMNRMEDRMESMKGVDRTKPSMDTRMDRETRTFGTEVHKEKGVFETDKPVFSGFRDSHVVVQVRDVIRRDPAFVSFAGDVDFIECNGNLIVFGVVPTVKERTAIETKIKAVEGVSNVQNKLILKNK